MPRLRVLIADDTEVIRRLLRDLLAEHCEIVGEAKNGRDAVELADRLTPDLVIMDYQMPLMGGLEATREIKKRHPDVEVFGYTSAPFSSSENEMLEAGAEASFDKLHLEDLVDAVAERARRNT